MLKGTRATYGLEPRCVEAVGCRKLVGKLQRLERVETLFMYGVCPTLQWLSSTPPNKQETIDLELNMIPLKNQSS